MKRKRITLTIRYSEKYLPSPRHRKLRTREARKDITLYIPVLTADEAPVAFRLSDYSHTSDNKPEVRAFRKKLYEPELDYHRDDKEPFWKPTPADRIVQVIRNYIQHCFLRDLETVEKDARQVARRFIIVGDTVWTVTGEPRYVVMTFGLGHNHGGTALMVHNEYNSNIPNTRYFSALDGDKAVAEADRIAAARGDTNYVGTFTKDIEVLLPEYVKLRPMKEHGKGDPFMNHVESLTERAGSVMEAGLLTMIAALK